MGRPFVGTSSPPLGGRPPEAARVVRSEVAGVDNPLEHRCLDACLSLKPALGVVNVAEVYFGVQ